MCSPEELTSEHVAKAAQEGDFLAQSVLAESGRLLGVALAGLSTCSTQTASSSAVGSLKRAIGC
jgi:predicted NBD/HSP70 family sugar kinase